MIYCDSVLAPITAQKVFARKRCEYVNNSLSVSELDNDSPEDRPLLRLGEKVVLEGITSATATLGFVVTMHLQQLKPQKISLPGRLG